MPLELKQQVWALSQAITFEATSTPIISSGDVMLTLSSATQHRRRVQMRYRSEQGQDTDRLFDPYGLAHRQGRWYVVGWCGLRQCLRSFRVDRVANVDVTDVTFERPEDFDALVHIVQSIASLPRQYRFTVLLKTDLATAQKEIVGSFGLLEPCDQGVRLRGSADNLDWVVGQLALCTFDFVIEDPQELKDALQSHVVRLTRLAE